MQSLLYASLRCRPVSCRHLASVTKKAKNAIPDNLLPFLHGRKGNERLDSVTRTMLEDRRMHRNRFVNLEISDRISRYLEKHGFGSKKYRETFESMALTAQWDFAEHLTSTNKDWPLFQHILPEICFAGHSNSGKSTLVNVMCGFTHNNGPASVSDRAGWTDQVCFYQVGKRPPVLTLADLPGYGHAIASSDVMARWKAMNRDYLKNRPVLCRCLVLVDSTRGLCAEDEVMIRFLRKNNIPWQVVLTKCDLLSLQDLARSILLVENDLLTRFRVGSNQLWTDNPDDLYFNKHSTISRVNHRLVIPVSSNHGGGVINLWREIKKCALASTVPPPSTSSSSTVSTTAASSMLSKENKMAPQSKAKTSKNNTVDRSHMPSPMENERVIQEIKERDSPFRNAARFQERLEDKNSVTVQKLLKKKRQMIGNILADLAFTSLSRDGDFNDENDDENDNEELEVDDENEEEDDEDENKDDEEEEVKLDLSWKDHSDQQSDNMVPTTTECPLHSSEKTENLTPQGLESTAIEEIQLYGEDCLLSEDSLLNISPPTTINAIEEKTTKKASSKLSKLELEALEKNKYQAPATSTSAVNALDIMYDSSMINLFSASGGTDDDVNRKSSSSMESMELEDLFDDASPAPVNPDTRVKEHYLAHKLRQQKYAERNMKNRK